MLVSRGRWFDRRTPDSRWPSFVVSIALTVAIFAIALESMQRRAPLFAPAPIEHPTPVTLQLAPPPAPPIHRPATRESSARAVPAAPAAPVAPVRADTVGGGSPGASSNKPATGAAAPGAGGAPGAGAPPIPLGVKVTAETPFVLEYSDSLARVKRDSEFRAMAMKHAPTGREKMELESSQRSTARVMQRSTSVGMPVHIPMGAGMGGVGADGGGAGGGSIGVPLFSKGPSAKQRKRNEAIHAEYEAWLARAQEIIKHRRDSVIADSIAKAKAHIVPG